MQGTLIGPSWTPGRRTIYQNPLVGGLTITTHLCIILYNLIYINTYNMGFLNFVSEQSTAGDLLGEQMYCVCSVLRLFVYLEDRYQFGLS